MKFDKIRLPLELKNWKVFLLEHSLTRIMFKEMLSQFFTHE